MKQSFNQYLKLNESTENSQKDDGVVNSKMLDSAITAILKKIKLDRNHDIPYLAGYSTDHKTIYIDKDLPESFKDASGKEHETDKFLILHESTEKALLDMWEIHYQYAHQIALRAEEAAVRAAGIRWKDYDGFMQKQIKIADTKELTKVPKNLDLKPYFDEKDTKLIAKMKKAMV